MATFLPLCNTVFLLRLQVHYAYICDAFGAFMGRYRQQAAAHTGAARGAAQVAR